MFSKILAKVLISVQDYPAPRDDVLIVLMKFLKHLILGVLILITTKETSADWTAKVDYSPCPRQFIPAGTGSEGGFATEAACRSRLETVQQTQKLKCAVYSCQASAGGATDAAAPGHEMDQHIGNAIAAGITGDIPAADALGLTAIGLAVNAFSTPATPETPSQLAARIQNERAWAEQMARENEAARVKEAAYQSGQDSKSLAFLDLASAEFEGKKPNVELSQGFTKGFDHSSSCISQNSGPSCSGLSASQQDTCIADYRAGYESGIKKQNLMLEEAVKEGLRAAANGERQNGFSNAGATGPCRNEWIKSYDNGYAAGRKPKAKL